jgi:DNA-binding MurR/RpiR family transcriptional regulator
MTKKTTPKKLTDNLKLKIRNDFVHGINKDGQKIYPTLDELIKKYNVAQSTIYRTAKFDNWKIQKEQFQADYQKKLDKQRQKNNISKSIQLDDQSLTLANALFATIGQTIQINNQNMKNGKKGLIPTQINALANTLATAQRTAKLALGEATHNIDATVNENNDSFRRAMELLDSVEESRSKGNSTTY